MNKKIKKTVVQLLLLFLSSQIFAETSTPVTPTTATTTPNFYLFSQSEHPRNMWSISGILHNEHDEPYAFTFNVYRQQMTYQVVAALINITEKKLVWQKTESVSFGEHSEQIEQIGNFFWHFSPINSTLILGYQDKNTQIFNLKLDLLEPTTITQTSSLTKNLKFNQYWSGRINGHLNINNIEQFVSSDNALLQQIWQNQSEEHHPFQEISCKFQDGSSIFAIQLPEKQATHAALAGKFDHVGQRQPISQFINIQPPEKQNHYDIILGKNKEILNLESIYNANHIEIYMGQMDKQQIGFCVYQKNPWINLKNVQPAKTNDTFLAKTFALGKKPFKIPFNLKNKSTS
jgi:hypothetical protein